MKLQDASTQRGIQTRSDMRAILERLGKIASKKRREPDEVRVLVTPPVQTDQERGEGDSINARLHRILHGEN